MVISIKARIVSAQIIAPAPAPKEAEPVCFLRTTLYPCCDDCGNYIATGDPSAVVFHCETEDEYNERLALIDATQGAILRDSHTGGWWGESLETRESGDTCEYQQCMFCGDEFIGSQHAVVFESVKEGQPA